MFETDFCRDHRKIARNNCHGETWCRNDFFIGWWHAKKCVERFCEQLRKVATPCMDDHQIEEEENGSIGELLTVGPQIVMTFLYLARFGRPDNLWSVNKLAPSITKWTKACDKRLNRLISYIHHTCEYRQYCHVGNTAKQCRLGLFQDSDFAGDLEDSKSTSGGTLCIFGSHTFVPISWMCEKQTSVSHNSTESEINSLDAGFRMDGLLALDLWDIVIEVFCSTNSTVQPNHTSSQETDVKRSQLCDVDYVHTNTHSSRIESQLCIFADNEAVIKMFIKGRSPTMWHVSRTDRVAFDWLFDKINSIMLTPKTNSQTFSRDEWNYFLRLFNIWVSRFILVATWVIFFLTIRFENRAPCQNEVKRRLRTKALRWRKRDHAWWRVTRGVKKSLHKVWDLWSIREYRWKKRSRNSSWKQHAVRFKIRNRVLSSESTRECSASNQETGAGGSTPITQWWEKHSNSNSTRRLAASTPELKNIEYTNHQYMSKIFRLLQKRLGMSVSDATFSMQAFETNVLIRGMFMSSSMKAAIHLGPNYLSNSEIYKKTKFEEIDRLFNITVCSILLRSW